MSWFSKLFKKQPKNSRYADSMNGWLPIFGQYGTNIYASDAVQQCLSCIVKEMKKLNPTHVRYINEDPSPVKGNVQSILEEPNQLMTTSDFLEKITWLLLLNYNVFIIPTYYTWVDKKTGEEKRYYESLYPIKPNQVDFIEDATGRLYVKFYFNNGYNTTIAYDNVIHIKYNYSVNEYMGGNEQGQPDHTALLETLELNNQLLKGVAKAMNASYAVNGVIQYNTIMDDGKTEAALKDLEQKLRNNESGFLPLDLKSSFTPIQRNTQIVDEATLKFIDEKILRNYHVSLPILIGDYTKEQYEAFYQSALEPLIISMSQAFTKKMFTPRERGFGNRIEFYPKALIFMSIDQTLKMIEMLSPTGGLYENEKRTALGLKPLPELEGKRYMSLNWIDAKNANQYQIGKNKDINVDVVDENKTEKEV